MKDLWLGPCQKLMKSIPDNSVDLLATDPPYAMVSSGHKEGKKSAGGFMQKKWDASLPPVAVWKECLRVLKPGAFAFIMCTPRADCLWRMMQRIEEAGFVLHFSTIVWAYASGFPKAQSVKKYLLRCLTTELQNTYNIEEDDIEWED